VLRANPVEWNPKIDIEKRIGFAIHRHELKIGKSGLERPRLLPEYRKSAQKFESCPNDVYGRFLAWKRRIFSIRRNGQARMPVTLGCTCGLQAALRNFRGSRAAVPRKQGHFAERTQFGRK
jgi:hypothetical protein